MLYVLFLLLYVTITWLCMCVSVCVQVHDGNSSTAPEIARLCGIQPPTTINSSSHELYIKLRTDNSVNAGGFLASYTSSMKHTHKHTHYVLYSSLDQTVLLK